VATVLMTVLRINQTLLFWTPGPHKIGWNTWLEYALTDLTSRVLRIRGMQF